MRDALNRLAANCRAAVAVEFALILPMMALLAGGVFTLGSLVHTYVVVNRLAMQYAISFADCSDTASGVCLTELDEYCTTAAFGNIAPQLSTANLTLQMAQIKMSGTTPSVVEYGVQSLPSQSACASFSLGSLSAAQTTALQATAFSGQTVVLVTVSYNYQVALFTAIMTPIVGSNPTISATVVQLK